MNDPRYRLINDREHNQTFMDIMHPRHPSLVLVQIPVPYNAQRIIYSAIAGSIQDLHTEAYRSGQQDIRRQFKELMGIDNHG